MLVSKTPLRVSFFGGGTDIPAYYERHGGFCLSTTIDKYVYIAMNRCVADHVRVIYSKLEQVDHFINLEHDRVRESLREYGPWGNVEICSFSDIPTYGTGLGSSSTFTVGLINMLTHDPNDRDYYKKEGVLKLAERACAIEIKKCGAPIGKQDQYAAAHGGLNAFIFGKDGSVVVDNLSVKYEARIELQDNLMLFSTGISRRADDILKTHLEEIDSGRNLDVLHETSLLAIEAADVLKRGNVERFGKMLNEAWELKRSLPGVTNPVIDSMYQTALKSGALGGKLLGAGGGGYMLLYVPKSNRSRVIEALRGFDHLPFKFSYVGSTVTEI